MPDYRFVCYADYEFCEREQREHPGVDNVCPYCGRYGYIEVPPEREEPEKEDRCRKC